jgi:hypothetical protein
MATASIEPSASSSSQEVVQATPRRWPASVAAPLSRSRTQASSADGQWPLRRLLADSRVTMVVVEHRDRLARMNAEVVEAALAAHGRRLVVLDDDAVRSTAARRATWSRRRCRHRLVGACRHERAQKLPAGLSGTNRLEAAWPTGR